MIADIPWGGRMIKVTLLPIRPAVGGRPPLYLYEDAAVAFVEMDRAARAAGIRLDVNTAFRDHAYQTRLYNEYLARNKTPPVVARPGTSDHERGLSVDMETGVPERLRRGPVAEKKDASPVYKWLAENAGRFDFENDVASEPWHWTFQTTSMKVAKAAGGGMILLTGIAGLWWFFGRNA